MDEQLLLTLKSHMTQFSQRVSSIEPSTLLALNLLNHSFIVSNLVYNRFDDLKRRSLIKEIPFLVGLLCVLCTGLGGSMLNSLIQAKAQPFLLNDTLFVVMFVAWILVLYFPFGLVRHVLSFPLIEIVSYGFEGLFVANIVIGAVNGAANDFPTSMFAPLLIGTLSASGGAILRPFFTNQYVGEPVESTVLSQPTLAIKVPLFCSLFYYVATRIYEPRTLSYEIRVDKVSFGMVELSAELIVQAIFVLFWLYMFYAKFVSRFFATTTGATSKARAPATKSLIDTRGISSSDAKKVAATTAAPQSTGAAANKKKGATPAKTKTH